MKSNQFRDNLTRIAKIPVPKELKNEFNMRTNNLNMILNNL